MLTPRGWHRDSGGELQKNNPWSDGPPYNYSYAD